MNLAELRITDVWEALGGPPLRVNHHASVRAAAFWRGSKDRNVSISIQKNCFCDWPTDNKGGVLKLVQTVRDCGTHDALTFLETYCALTPSRPLTPQEEHRRRIAQREAESLLQWRNKMLESLRKRRNRHWKLYHQSKNWILKYGLYCERGVLLAEVADIAEEEALRIDEAIERLSNLNPEEWAIVVEFYRSSARKAA